MAYAEIDFPPIHAPELPGEFARLIAAADRRWEAFVDAGLKRRYPRFVSSDPTQVYAAIRHVRERGLAPGNLFLEWGSGFGLATCIAALLGYEASGIELRAGLVEIAEALAASQGIAANFLHGSYIPEGYIEYETIGGTDIVPDESFGHSPEEAPGYEGLDHPIEEVDLFFAYPWPGEQAMMLKLFDAVAGEGALLVLYFGDSDIALYRKR